jgi:hypothetical protein
MARLREKYEISIKLSISPDRGGVCRKIEVSTILGPPYGRSSSVHILHPQSQ